MIETVLFLFLFMFLFLVLRYSGKTTSNNFHLPPSPPSLPLLGHLHLLSPSLHTSLHALSAAHIFKTHDLAFSYRPAFAFADKLPFGGAGFVTAPYGPYWRLVKKLCVTELLSPQQLERSKKVRRKEMESWVKGVLENVKGKGGAIDVGPQLIKLTNNVTCRMAMSTWYPLLLSYYTYLANFSNECNQEKKIVTFDKCKLI